MKVLHLSPTYFDNHSVIGGAERYAWELAKAMARKAEVHFVSFGAAHESWQEGPLTCRRLVSPSLGALLNEIKWAEVIHCHQVYRWQTDYAVVAGRLSGRKVFASDLGGFGKNSLSYHFPILRCLNGMLFISSYSKQLWEKRLSPGRRPKIMEVVWGGVDLQKFQPNWEPRTKKILFVGRILSHKGVDVLIDAAEADMEIEIVGHPYDEKYLSLLKEKAKNKRIQFSFNVSDEDLVRKYQTALVTVLPSVYRTCDGHEHESPELLGLVLLESLATSTPVIVTNVASLPEIVLDGESGFIIPPNDPVALREKLLLLMDQPAIGKKMGRRGSKEILEKFTWDLTAERCLQAYGK